MPFDAQPAKPSEGAAHKLARGAAAPYVLRLAGLLGGAFLLFMGQGVFLVLVPLRLAATGEPAWAVSLVGAAYFAGTLAGTWFNGAIIRSIGNVRTFGGFVGVMTAAGLGLAVVEGSAAWGMLRFVHGWGTSATFLAIETWLHAATPSAWRGRMIGSYTLLTLLGLLVGQLLVTVNGGEVAIAGDIGAILLALSLAPVLLGKADAPPMPAVNQQTPFGLYRRAPLAGIGCLSAGMLMGSYWSLGPLLATRIGLGHDQVSFFMAAAIGGGMLFVLPVGRLSDRGDRRLVLGGIGILCATAGFTVLAVEASALSCLLPLVGLYGAAIFSLYPVSVSLAADQVGAEGDMIGTLRATLLAYGIGTSTGPLVTGQVIGAIGPGGYFVTAGAIAASLAALCLLRAARQPSTPKEERKAFVPVPETSPASAALDPRVEDPQLELPL